METIYCIVYLETTMDDMDGETVEVVQCHFDEEIARAEWYRLEEELRIQRQNGNYGGAYFVQETKLYK